MTTHPIFAALLVLLVSPYAHGETGLVCPAQIAEPSVRIHGIEMGWTAFIAAPLYLHSAAVTDGPPEKLTLSMTSG